MGRHHCLTSRAEKKGVDQEGSIWTLSVDSQWIDFHHSTDKVIILDTSYIIESKHGSWILNILSRLGESRVKQKQKQIIKKLYRLKLHNHQ